MAGQMKTPDCAPTQPGAKVFACDEHSSLNRYRPRLEGDGPMVAVSNGASAQSPSPRSLNAAHRALEARDARQGAHTSLIDEVLVSCLAAILATPLTGQRLVETAGENRPPPMGAEMVAAKVMIFARETLLGCKPMQRGVWVA